MAYLQSSTDRSDRAVSPSTDLPKLSQREAGVTAAVDGATAAAASSADHGVYAAAAFSGDIAAAASSADPGVSSPNWEINFQTGSIL